MLARSRRFLSCALLVMAVALAPSARAGAVLAAKVLRVPGATLQQVDAVVSQAPDGGLDLTLDAARADIPVMGWRRVGLHLEGRLQRDASQRWSLAGTVKLSRAPGHALDDAHINLEVDTEGNTAVLELLQDKAVATTWVPLDQLTHVQVQLKNLPFAWLQGFLSTVWSGQAKAGRVSAEMALDQRDSGVQASGEFSLDALGFDTPSGTLAGQGLGGSGRFSVDTTGGPGRISLDSTLHGGELLLGSFYAQLPGHAVQLSLDAQSDKGSLDFPRLRVSDPDAMQLAGSLSLDGKGDLQALELSRLQLGFPEAYQRYGKAWLRTFGLSEVSSSGDLSASLDLRRDGLHAFAFSTDGMDFGDAEGRLAVRGLKGGLDWSADGTQPATSLSWQSLKLYRLVNGPAQSRWRSRDGLLSLQSPMQMSLLDGTVRVSELGWRPAAGKGERMSASLAVTGVDMRAFSRTMGWPEFPGTLGGAISGLRVSGDSMALDGGLSINVFGGFVDVTGLSLQHPFGDSPVLTSDISLRQLDLGAMTSVFDFGSITGPLDGTIQGLRLSNWQPVAFDARLLASGGGRISQRAVNNLTSVGGGGIAGGLQGAMLKLFKSFGYDRIGLNCRLQGTVCHMSGLEAHADGYTIVDGRGLPHLEVIGHQADVDWPTLVRRLKAATEGTAPEIR